MNHQQLPVSTNSSSKVVRSHPPFIQLSDPQFQKHLYNIAQYETKFKSYASAPRAPGSKCAFVPGVELLKPNHVCDVRVVRAEPLEVVKEFAFHGDQWRRINKQQLPAVVHMISQHFTGTDISNYYDDHDLPLGLCTTFSASSPYASDLFPLKTTECAYVPYVTVIRDLSRYDTLLPPNMSYTVSSIICSPPVIERVLPVKENCMFLAEYLTCTAMVETIFQTAALNKHSVIVVPPLGHQFNKIPVADMTKIMNYCICKYNRQFKAIIIAVPPYYPKPIYDQYSQDIFNFRQLTSDVDREVEIEENMRKLNK